MTNTAAYQLPDFSSPRFEEKTAPTHIEIVSTRAQRRGRPRVVYALIAVGGLFLILMAQLMMSILLSNGAYEIASLQSTHKNLSRDQQTLTESLQVLNSPQNLAVQAESLGMVINSSGSGRILLSTGAVLNAPTAAGAASATDASAGTLVPNALLTPAITAAETAAAVAAGATIVTPATPTATGPAAAGSAAASAGTATTKPGTATAAAGATTTPGTATAAAGATAATSTVPGAPSTTAGAGSVTSGTIPAPMTH